MHVVSKLARRVGSVLFLAMLMLAVAVPAFAQADDPGGLGAGAKAAATNGVALGAAVALVILAAILVYKLIRRFSS